MNQRSYASKQGWSAIIFEERTTMPSKLYHSVYQICVMDGILSFLFHAHCFLLH